MPYTDQFGFVPVDVSLSFEAASIQPVDDIHSIIDWMPSITNPDGYIYPPVVHTRRGWPESKSKKIKGSDRGAFLFRLPATHRLTIEDSDEGQEASRYGDAGFLIHFFGLLYGFRCQFHDWWLDGRCNAKSDADFYTPRREAAEACAERALTTFRSLGASQKMVAINVMYLHARIGMYESEWERFQAAYLVADAVFALAKHSGLSREQARVGHPRRLMSLCEAFGLAPDEDKIRYMVSIRNDLLHEALWVGGMPGHASKDLRSFYASMWLENFARRALFALLGLGGSYISSAWWGLGTHFFDLKPTS